MKRAELELPAPHARSAPALRASADSARAAGPNAARSRAEPPPAPRAPGGLLPPVWFALALSAMLALHFALPLVQWNLGMTRWWGLPFSGAGLALVVCGVRGFARRTTLHPFREPSQLVTTGCFAWSRNPMYTGLVLSLLGAALMLGSLSPVACVPPFVWLLRHRFIAHEEGALEEQFGDAYRHYRLRVRRWL